MDFRGTMRESEYSFEEKRLHKFSTQFLHYNKEKNLFKTDLSRIIDFVFPWSNSRKLERYPEIQLTNFKTGGKRVFACKEVFVRKGKVKGWLFESEDKIKIGIVNDLKKYQ